MEILDKVKQLAVLIQKRKDADYRRHHLFLTRCLPASGTREGYQALARLAHTGYFSIILTSNTDTALEVAFKEQGLSQYEVFVVGHTPDEQIAAALEGLESGICIVKLYGNTPQMQQTSFFSMLSPEVQTSLKYYFNQSIIIVGCMDQEEDDIAALHSYKERTIHYVLQNAPSPEDTIVKYLHQQDKQLEDFLIGESYGEFNTFFSTLEKNIKDRIGQNQASPPVNRNIVDDTKELSARDHSGNNLSVTNPIRVFYIYSSKKEDLRLQEKIESHLVSLRERGLISDWHYGKLDAGTEREVEIKKHLESDQVILLLVSSAFISSEYYYLVTRAMERHKSGSVVVIPIILRPVYWQETAFGGLTALPDGGRPITSWPDQDKACLNVAQGIRKIIDNLRPESK